MEVLLPYTYGQYILLSINLILPKCFHVLTQKMTIFIWHIEVNRQDCLCLEAVGGEALALEG